MVDLLKYEFPKANPKRIICHWTAGSYMASSVDREHYHFLVEEDGLVVIGNHKVSDNDSTSDGNYAAHTRRKNTGSIGIAVCCMAGATREDPGPFRMTEPQWFFMAIVAAQLCNHYNIPVSPKTVLGHFEVERLLGIKQRGKWDPGFLPWNPEADDREVGDRFRKLVEALINAPA